MKKIFTLAFTGLMNLCFSQAPISIVSADFGGVGDTLRSVKDTIPTGFSIGNTGANQYWDFSFLTPDVPVINYVVARTSTPYSSTFTTANIAVTPNFVDYLFADKNNTAYNLKGFAGDIGGLGLVTSVNFNPTVDSYRFPTEYNNTFSGNYGFTKTIPFSQLPPALQTQIQQAAPPGTSVLNVRVTFSSNFTDLIDAWGTAKTPVGIYHCLRQKRAESTITIIEAEVRVGTPPFSFDSWQEVQRITANPVTHWWLTKTTKEPLISLEYDSLRNISAVTYSLSPAPNIAPVAVNDTASVTYPDSVIINVLTNDSDLNGNNISFQYLTNPVSGSATDLGGGNVKYKSNPGFSGIDTFRYVICDDGIPVLCDTATVAVDVDFSNEIRELLSASIQLFPNPVAGTLNISIKSSVHERLEFHLYNSLGKRMPAIFKQEQWGYSLNLSHFLNGVYFLKAYTEDQREIFSERFILNGN